MIRVKRLICFGLLLALLTAPVVMAVPDAETSANEIAAETEEATIDTTHLEAMLTAARDGSNGAGAEAAWNRQIQAEDLRADETTFFETEDTPYEITVAIADYLVAMGITELDGQVLQFQIVASSLNLREGPAREYARIGSFAHGTVVTSLGQRTDGWLEVTDGELVGWTSAIHLAPFDGTPAPVWVEPVTQTQGGGSGSPGSPGGSGSGTTTNVSPTNHTQDDLFWLALTIQIEAGSDGCCDRHQRLVGEVVLNRVAHHAFPSSTIHGIVHQAGQYPWAARGVRVPISDRALANAQWLLNGNRISGNPNLVFQAQFPQGRGGTFETIHCSLLGTTTWFGIWAPH